MRAFLLLPERRTVAVLDTKGGLRLEEQALPEPGPGELLFRLLAAGVSASDLNPALHGGRIPPAAVVGEIAAIGSQTGGWGPLDRALMLPVAESGLPRLEGLASYVLVPRALADRQALLKLDLRMSVDDATLLPAAALAARLLREARIPAGGSLLVLGLGLVAQNAVLLARHQKVETILAADLSPTLRRRAEWSGATHVFSPAEVTVRDAVAQATGGAGVHAVLVLAGEGSWVHEAVQSLAPRGTLVLASALDPHLMVALPGAWIQRRELRLQGVTAFERKNLREAMQALDQGIVNAETLVSRRVPWAELDGFRLDEDYWQHALHVVVEGPEE